MPPLAGRLRLPYSVLLAIVGFVLGLIIHVHGWAPLVVSDFLDSLQDFEVSSETFLFVFLPILLFETSLRSEEHTSELQSLMRISYAVFCLKKNKHSSYP